MLRLALLLGAAVYAGLVIFSEPAADVAGSVEVARAATPLDVTMPASRSNPDIFVTADGRELRIAAVIDPGALDDGSSEIALVSTGGTDTITSSASAGVPEVPDLPLVEITGNHVNLRAGPSTGDAVLGAMARGEHAELMASPGNGWVQIRALSTGVEGFMSDSFVSPLN